MTGLRPREWGEGGGGGRGVRSWKGRGSRPEEILEPRRLVTLARCGGVRSTKLPGLPGSGCRALPEAATGRRPAPTFSLQLPTEVPWGPHFSGPKGSASSAPVPGQETEASSHPGLWQLWQDVAPTDRGVHSQVLHGSAPEGRPGSCSPARPGTRQSPQCFPAAQGHHWRVTHSPLL